MTQPHDCSCPSPLPDADRAQTGCSCLYLEDYRAAFLGAAEGMAMATLDGRLCLINRAWCDLFGRPDCDLLGKSFADLFDGRSRDFITSRLPLLRTGALRQFQRDCTVSTPSKGPLFLLVSFALVRDEAGEPANLVIQARDVTEARQVERVLLDSDRRFRTIFNALSEGFIETDARGRVIDLNDPMCRMIGAGRETIIGRPIRRYLDSTSRAHLRTALSASDQLCKTFEISLRNDITHVALELQIFATILTNAHGKPTGATAIVLDVSERNLAQAALRQSEQRNRLMVEALQDGLVMLRNGRFDYVNAPFARMLGYSVADLVGNGLALVVPDAEELHDLEQHFAQRLSGKALSEGIKVSFRTADGHLVLGQTTCAVVRHEDGGVLVIATIKDVTEQQHITDMLRTLSSAVEHSPAVVMITDANGMIEYVNPKFTEVTGFSFEDSVGQRPSILSSGQTPRETYEEMWRTLHSGKEWHGEFRNRRRDGEIYWDSTSVSPIRDASGTVARFVAIKEDITNRKESELLNWRRANFDQVTGLPNRVLFKDRLVQTLHRSRRDGTAVAVMFIDLDRFKAVNDTLGHEAGDAVLKEVAVRLTRCVRDSDTIARLAGDEFTAILPKPGDEKTSAAIAHRILESLRRPFELENNQQAHIGGSIGIAIYPNDGSDAETLLHCADLAMYRAKNGGRNSYHFYTSDMNVIAEQRQQQENDIRRALSEDQIAVHFLPSYAADGQTLRAVEAHCRWAHPVRGLMSAPDFAPIAEDIGLGMDLMSLTLKRACMATALWRAGCPQAADLALMVPVSSRVLSSPHFTATLEAALDSSGLPPEALILLIPQHVLLAPTPVVEASLRAVNERCVRLMLSDFGTGTFSPQLLRRFPFAGLKVETSQIRHLLDMTDDAVLVEAILSMAQKLGLPPMAQGIDSAEQVALLQCRYPDAISLYQMASPLPKEEISALVGISVPLVGAE